jgi:hypothetical protein
MVLPVVILSLSLHAQQQPDSARAVGTLVAIATNQISLKDDRGRTVTIQVGPSTRLVRVAPGQKGVANAPTIQLSDVHPGDRMLVTGTSQSAESITANKIVVMTGHDLAQLRSAEEKSWQNGPRGLVTRVDVKNGIVAVKSAIGVSTTIQIPPSASLLRYRDGSSKFSEAQAAKLDQIKIGDQLQAKGKPDASGMIIADSVVFGTFVNIAGRIASVDAASNAVTVNDVFTKKAVTLHITADSQMRQLPVMIAQRIAVALQRSDPDQSGSGRPGRAIDFQQAIARLPSIGINDLHKGDAVIAVAGSSSAQSPAFYFVDGVEPILTASPGGSGAAALLASWSLSAGRGEGE